MNSFAAIAISFTMLCVYSSCRKAEPEERFEIIEVREFQSGDPVAGARITLYECTDYDAVFGCQLVRASSIHGTNSSGIANIKSTDLTDADEGIKISKPGYWERDGQVGINQLCAEGFIDLKIHKVNSYNDSLVFILYNTSEQSPFFSSQSVEMLKMNVKDTSITIKAFGGLENTLTWFVFKVLIYFGEEPGLKETIATGTLPPHYVAARRSVSVLLNY